MVRNLSMGCIRWWLRLRYRCCRLIFVCSPSSKCRVSINITGPGQIIAHSTAGGGSRTETEVQCRPRHSCWVFYIFCIIPCSVIRSGSHCVHPKKEVTIFQNLHIYICKCIRAVFRVKRGAVHRIASLTQSMREHRSFMSF